MKIKTMMVGQLFQEGKTVYKEEVQFDIQQGTPTLYLFFNSPLEQEFVDIKSGNFSCGLYIKDDLIFSLFKFGSCNWVDAPYSAHLSKPFTLDDASDGMGYASHILLIDAATGILKAIRLVGLPTQYSRYLKRAITKQKQYGFNKIKYDQDVRAISEIYTTNDMVQRADIIEHLIFDDKAA